MFETRNGDVNVDELMSRVQSEVLRRQLGESADGTLVGHGLALDTSGIDALLTAAAQRAEPRASLPRRLRIFPFNVPVVQRFLLRVYNVFFRDQRHVNAALVNAMREVVAMNRELYRRTVLLEQQLARSERQN